MLTKEDLKSISDLLDERFKAELGPIREDMKEMKEDIRGLKSDVKILKEDVAVLKEDVAVLKEEVADLKENVQVLQDDVQDLKGSVDLLNVKVNRNTRKLKGLEMFARNWEYTSSKRIAKLQDGMDTIEEVLRINHLITH